MIHEHLLGEWIQNNCQNCSVDCPLWKITPAPSAISERTLYTTAEQCSGDPEVIREVTIIEPSVGSRVYSFDIKPLKIR